MTTNTASAPTTRDRLRAHIATATDETLATAFRMLLDNGARAYLQLDEAGRLTAAVMSDEIARRHPELDQRLGDWADDLDTQDTYEGIVLDFLTEKGL